MEVKALRKSIEEQLSAVEEHIAAIKSMGGGWESNSKENIEKCNHAKAANIRTFNRWHSVWPSLQIMLNSDAESPAAMSALATLQGFVKEWVTLRTLASDIKVSIPTQLYEMLT